MNPASLIAQASRRQFIVSGGGWYLLGVQCLTTLCLVLWSFSVSITLLWLINKVIPIRMNVHDELLGADLVEHRIRHMQVYILGCSVPSNSIVQSSELSLFGFSDRCEQSYVCSPPDVSRARIRKRTSCGNKSG